MANKTIIKRDSYSIKKDPQAKIATLKKVSLAATSVWLLAACANLGFVFGGIPYSKEIDDFRNAEAVENYRQEQLADLDELYNDGGLAEEEYVKMKKELEGTSKSKLADIVYKDNARYAEVLKTKDSLSICSIVANSFVIGAVLTYLGTTIKISKERKKEMESTIDSLEELVMELMKLESQLNNSDDDEIFKED